MVNTCLETYKVNPYNNLQKTFYGLFKSEFDIVKI